MRITIRLPDDVMQRVALDALKKRRNSKEAVIAEILRAYYGGTQVQENHKAALRWRISTGVEERILDVRRFSKEHWK